jgi:hypothetical protein
MLDANRIDGLRRCEGEYRAALGALNVRVVTTPERERPPLRELQAGLDSKLRQVEIEIAFLTDPAAFRTEYIRRRDDALRSAQAETVEARKKALEAHAAFLDVVIDDALTTQQSVRPIDETSLRPILANLRTAAQEAKDTVQSINRAIGITNRVLDALIVLARVAARLAV